MMNRQKLRVAIRHPKEWTAGAVKVLDGQVGTVDVVKTTHDSGNTRRTLHTPLYLMTFDPPLPSIWQWGSPVTAYWFEETELQPENTR